MTRVYVPSKGRAGRSATLSMLLAEDHPDVRIVTPLEETQRYSAEYGLSAIPQVGKGIGGARQTILEHARSDGLDRFWMIDDDTTGCYEREVGGTHFHRISMSDAMSQMEAGVLLSTNEIEYGDNIAMFGPQFRHRAWSGPPAEKDVHLRNFVCVRTNIRGDYWPFVKEDLDMVLQAITAGQHTIRFNVYAFDSPRMGTTEGGCFDDYANGELEKATVKLAHRWPGLVHLRLNDATGYIENRVDWHLVRQRTIKGPRELA